MMQQGTVQQATGATGEHEILKATEAAEILRTSRQNVLRLAKNGDIPAVRIGGMWRFSRRALIEFVAGGGGDA